MHSQLNIGIAQARHRDLVDAAARRRPWLRRASSDSFAPRWEALTMRLATSADRAALERLAELEQAAPPTEPVLLGVLMQRPVAALSLADGRVVADPFTHTCELIELMRMRARQIRRAR